MALTLLTLKDSFAVCRLSPESEVPLWLLKEPFFCATRTADELSILLSETALAKQNTETHSWKVEGGWRALKVLGPLDFSLTGILSSLAAPLAVAGISIFALSTYDTDYVLVRSETLQAACAVLSKQGFIVISE
jgi:uncharacterized protein